MGHAEGSRSKDVGQECPTHTCNFNTKNKSKTNFNTDVNGVGQECPTQHGHLTVRIDLDE